MASPPQAASNFGGRIDERLARRGGAVELLRVPAALYGAAIGARSALYELGLFQSVRVDAPVVSVGNLSAGGTGKTPMVALVVRELERRGRRAGVLSRGYGAKVAGSRAERASGNGASSRSAQASDVGASDEAALLAEILPGVEHVEDADRVRGARELVRRGVDAIVLDDGFQHRRLARDLDVVLVDATRPWGLEASGAKPPVRALLPRGLLREPATALARADAIVITRVDQLDPRALEHLRSELATFAPGRPLMTSVHRASRVLDPQRRVLAPDALRGRPFVLVSGIGNPDAFERSARALGVEVREHHRRADHFAWSERDRELFRGDVLTTAKDAVKLRALGFACWVLEVELAIVEGAQVFEALLDSLRESGAALERRALHEGLDG